MRLKSVSVLGFSHLNLWASPPGSPARGVGASLRRYPVLLPCTHFVHCSFLHISDVHPDLRIRTDSETEKVEPQSLLQRSEALRDF